MASQQWTENVEPGTAELVRDLDNGTVTVRHADPAIIVDPAVIAELQSTSSAHVEADGTLVLDTAGEYRYQRVGERTVDGQAQLIYRRIQ